MLVGLNFTHVEPGGAAQQHVTGIAAGSQTKVDATNGVDLRDFGRRESQLLQVQLFPPEKPS
jgi:hypothetical protein